MYISIQYLRAISSLAVVYYHLYENTGQQGVAIFFVISGFLMIDIMQNKSAKKFFFDRYFRIAPLYYLSLVLVLMFGIAYDPTPLRIVQSFTFTALGSVYGVGWTLTYEFVFYTIVTVSLFLFSDQKYRLGFIFVSLILLDYFINYVHHIKGYEYGNYFYLFLSGVVINLIFNNFKIIIWSNFTPVLLLASFGYLFYGHSFGIPFYQFDVEHYLINNLVPSFLIVFLSLNLEKSHHIFKSRLLEYLGDASYSIYLSHMLIIALVTYFISDVNKIFLLIISVIMGVLIYHFLEKPITRKMKTLH